MHLLQKLGFMKRIILIALLSLAAFSASAQYAAVPEHIKVGGSSIYSGNEKLTVDQALMCFSDLNGVDRSADYLKYRKGYRTGLGLTIAGGSLFVGGTVVCSSATLVALVIGIPMGMGGNGSVLQVTNGLVQASTVCMIAGGGMVAAGVPVLCVNRRRINHLAYDYNQQMTVGPTANGLGLALNF